MSKVQNNKKARLLIILLSVGIVVCVAVTIWAVFFREPKKIITPDYAPGKLDPNAEKITGEDTGKLETPSGGGAISLQYVDKVTIDLSEKKAYLSYSNPSKSTQNIVLQIVIKDQVVVQSERIEPGYQVKVLPLLAGADKLLSKGTYTDAVFKILSYNPETGEKAMIDTKAEITVIVQE